MMGIKERRFDPLPRTVSQEDLVPADDLYRRLEERVYLSLVRDLVEYRYAAVDRPSVDPVVFFQLQLILFRGPEERTAAHEDSGRPPLFALVVRLRPTRTASRALVNTTRTRERFGLAGVLRRFFEESVGRCVEAGVDGRVRERSESLSCPSLTPFTEPDRLTPIGSRRRGNVGYSAFHDDSSLPVIFSSFSISIPKLNLSSWANCGSRGT
jgi:hypothetical protein